MKLPATTENVAALLRQYVADHGFHLKPKLRVAGSIPCDNGAMMLVVALGRKEFTVTVQAEE